MEQISPCWIFTYLYQITKQIATNKHKQRHRQCPQAPGPKPWSTPWHPPISCQLTPMGPLVPTPPSTPPPLAWTFWALCGLTRVDRTTQGLTLRLPTASSPPSCSYQEPPSLLLSQHLKQLRASTPLPPKSLGPAWAEGRAGPHRLVCGQGCRLQGRRSAGRDWGWHRCSG